VKIWTKRAAGIGAIIGGLLVAGTVAANAAPLSMVGSALSSIPFVGQAAQQVSRGDMAAPTLVQSSTARGIASGTAVGVGVSGNKVNAPVLLCGNTVNVVGRSKARCRRGAASSGSSRPSSSHNATVVSSRGARGILSGSAVGAGVNGNTVNAPVTACANSVNALGLSKGSC
jgi:hypothetical protein